MALEFVPSFKKNQTGPTTMSMSQLRPTDGWGIIGSTIIGLAINRFAKQFGSSDSLIGSPRFEHASSSTPSPKITANVCRWSYHVALLYQWTFFPGLFIYAWERQDFRLEWLDLPWRSMNAVRSCECV